MNWNERRRNKSYIYAMKKIIFTSKGPAPIGPYSQAVMAGNTLFVSGQIAIDPATGGMVTVNILRETNQVMNNLLAILTEAGMDFSNVVKTTIYLSDMNNFANVNEVYGEYFQSDFPARETVQVSRLPKDVNVEISVIAVK
jgi:2-iminobutanoate/2-iminopropanoate deaminase